MTEYSATWATDFGTSTAINTAAGSIIFIVAVAEMTVVMFIATSTGVEVTWIEIVGNTVVHFVHVKNNHLVYSSMIAITDFITLFFPASLNIA